MYFDLVGLRWRVWNLVVGAKGFVWWANNYGLVLSSNWKNDSWSSLLSKLSFFSILGPSLVLLSDEQINPASIHLWNLARRSLGLNGRTLRKLPLLAHAFHLKRVSPRMHSITSCGTRVHLASTAPNGYLPAQEPALSVNQTRSDVNGDLHGRISLHTFMQALQYAVDAQFADAKALHMASNTSRLFKVNSDNEWSAFRRLQQGLLHFQLVKHFSGFLHIDNFYFR